MAAMVLASAVGRSPLTRGSHFTLPGGSLGLRSIPAHAGEPQTTVKGLSKDPVDPRSRGGAGEQMTIADRKDGRSPLTRGSRRGLHPASDGERSIPAHAGEPAIKAQRPPYAKVDPRSRGGAPAATKGP